MFTPTVGGVRRRRSPRPVRRLRLPVCSPADFPIPRGLLTPLPIGSEVRKLAGAAASAVLSSGVGTGWRGAVTRGQPAAEPGAPGRLRSTGPDATKEREPAPGKSAARTSAGHERISRSSELSTEDQRGNLHLPRAPSGDRAPRLRRKSQAVIIALFVHGAAVTANYRCCCGSTRIAAPPYHGGTGAFSKAAGRCWRAGLPKRLGGRL
jgi:hypothetical protein